MQEWALLSGDELWNHARLAAYVANGVKPPTAQITVGECDGLLRALACLTDATGALVPPKYTVPSDPNEPAPWWDPLDPPSADFAGLLITGIEGAETAPLSRGVRRLIGDGASLGQPSYGPRQMVVTALLIGRTCCSLQSGLRWLNGVLRSSCTPSGAEMTYLECCPDTDDPVIVERHMRTLRHVGVTDGVTVTDRVGRSCGTCRADCTYMGVQFTLTAGDPYSYGPQVDLFEQFVVDGDYAECVTWTTAGNCESDGVGCGAGDCPAQDPRCPVAPLPPVFPAPDPCGCSPMASVGTCAVIPAGVVPGWQQMVPVVEVYAGENPLRSITVSIYSNPLGQLADVGGPEDLQDCDKCAEFTISYLQAGVTFTLDGRDKRFYLTCPGQPPTSGAQLMSGGGGRPFRWPVLDCGGGYSVCVSADATTAAPDATYRMAVVPRTPA